MSTNTPQTLDILRIDSSGRREGSVSRQLGELLLARLEDQHDSIAVTHRDVSAGLPLVDSSWIEANFTDPSERTPEQKAVLGKSDELIAELERADVLVLTVPIYNFGIPAALKSWIDMVARARKTFRYTENGPIGLLEGKKAYVLMASGGTQVGSDIDFASGYLRHILGFLGIHDVEVIAADRLMARGEDAVSRARETIEGLEAVA